MTNPLLVQTSIVVKSTEASTSQWIRYDRAASQAQVEGTTVVEFGLGKAQEVDRLEACWPSGLVQAFDDVPIDRRIYVLEGQD